MGTMKLIASNGQEVKQIKFPKISAEEIQEMVKEMKAHEHDVRPKFYDYVGCIGPIKPVPKSVVDQYEEIASKYGKKIEGINYDKCCTG